jgi:hypothetical protein
MTKKANTTKIEISMNLFRVHEAMDSMTIKGRLIKGDAQSYEIGIFGEAFDAIADVITEIILNRRFQYKKYPNSEITWMIPEVKKVVTATGKLTFDKVGSRKFPKINCNEAGSVTIKKKIVTKAVKRLQEALKKAHS